MGSVKNLIVDDSPPGRIYAPPTHDSFGRGAWRVGGTFSVRDLKDQIPPIEVPNKPAAMTMMDAAFFEYLGDAHPEIPTCYEGVMTPDGKMWDLGGLLAAGRTADIVVMKLAHVPDTYCDGDLFKYRKALRSGELQCGVADVESIFRHGFPLGSSTFRKIFTAVGRSKQYDSLATYDEVAGGLDEIREMVGKDIGNYPELAAMLSEYGLGAEIPNPGHILSGVSYDSTSKFEKAGDRPLTKEEEIEFSGLDRDGYRVWSDSMFPAVVQAQIRLSNSRGVLNMDGKCECVAYQRKPVLTDFACTTDENRLMVSYRCDGAMYLIPTNKEIQRAVFTKAGVDTAITRAKARAASRGGTWQSHMPGVTKDMNIDLREVADYSSKLMEYAMGEVANRMLGRRVFDTPHMSTWVEEFLPYASRLQTK